MNGKSPLVSILMNCYNSEEFLKEAIDSIYNQTYQNFEIIFIDNCSADNSKNIALSYDERVKYHRTQETIPLYAARAFAKQFINGKYLTFLDCDDIWLKDKLEYQVNKMEKENIDFMYTWAGLLYMAPTLLQKFISKPYLFVRSFFNLFRKSGFISKDHFILHYDIILQTVILRVDKIKNTNFSTKLNLYGDYDFFLKLIFLNNIKIFFDKKKTTLYRIHGNQLTRQSSENWLKEAQLLLEDDYSNIFTEQEKKSFEKANILHHQAHKDLQSGYIEEGLRKLKQTKNLSIRNKIHYYKTLIKHYRSCHEPRKQN